MIIDELEEVTTRLCRDPKSGKKYLVLQHSAFERPIAVLVRAELVMECFFCDMVEVCPQEVTPMTTIPQVQHPQLSKEFIEALLDAAQTSNTCPLFAYRASLENLQSMLEKRARAEETVRV
ncbi:MAG: hypothetical protein A3H70_04755 [Candidatus Komeilibacteria bacterium RIFCSPLOWO2_02_FULL_48_11]|uniref:Uncharacterized protein n=1 Tax=Candidatus Komeilibacteria bacterium RIFCSPLOWO2_02_FULL_48_11 TaxID=1798553 RepID=A0A1G2BUA8_9BACT|nr:MAG: hypothetical protein A3H70_04755 [Candidatus Komeilibacteria bacterium RIFCSPLOWO2_02_FULL_48_11]